MQDINPKQHGGASDHRFYRAGRRLDPDLHVPAIVPDEKSFSVEGSIMA
jgi:hypothetical protein